MWYDSWTANLLYLYVHSDTQEIYYNLQVYPVYLGFLCVSLCIVGLVVTLVMTRPPDLGGHSGAAWFGVWTGPGITASEGHCQPRITVPVRARRRSGRDVRRVTIMASSADLDAAYPASDSDRHLSGPARGPEERRCPPTDLQLRARPGPEPGLRRQGVAGAGRRPLQHLGRGPATSRADRPEGPARPGHRSPPARRR